MPEIAIRLASDFTRHPGPRYKRQGPYSGELFRASLLSALARSDVVLVDLDGTTGIGSSFIGEAFGGLVSKEGFTKAEIRRRLRIKSDEDSTYGLEVWDAVDLAEEQRAFA